MLTALIGFVGIPANAENSSTDQKTTTVRLSLGSESNKHRLFNPDIIVLEKGTRYKLVIDNPSFEVHEFDAPELLKAIKSSHVSVAEYFGKGAPVIAKVVGTPAEIEIFPGGAIAWEFQAVSKGKFEMICDVKDKTGKTHTAMGMKGTIIIR